MGCCKNNKCVQCDDGEKCTCKNDNDCTNSYKKTKKYLINYNDYIYSAQGNIIKGGSTIETFDQKHPLSNWIHQEGYISRGKAVKEGPTFIYNKIIEEYGNPDVIANQPNGICIWYIKQKNNDIHHSIELRDQYVDHCVPAKHNDFLYSYVNMYIPPEKIKQVLSVSGSVGYDGLQKLLYARCSSFEANMATIGSVFLVLNNKDPNYVYNIKNRYDSFENNKKLVREGLKKNQTKYKKMLQVPYYDLAFPKGCE